MNAPFQTYKDFLSQHSKLTTRRLHVFGTAAGLLVLIAGIARGEPVWLLIALIIGYGFAWAAHAFVENNRPATFSHPIWSLRGDLHMLWLWATGRLEAEVFHQKTS